MMSMARLEGLTDGEVWRIDRWVDADDFLQQSGYCTKAMPQHRRQVRHNLPLLAANHVISTTDNSQAFCTIVSKTFTNRKFQSILLVF